MLSAAVTECRRYQIRLGFVGLLLFSLLTCYQWNTFKNKALQVQDVRKQLIRKICESDKAAFSKGNFSLEELPKNVLQQLLVDDNHGFIYCFIPKVACTNWRRVMVSLNRGEPYQDPESIDNGLVHDPNIIPLLISSPEAEMKAKLKHYTKFLFVRDPFVRLISAYRDKFMKPNDLFYPYYAKNILRQYGNNSNPPETAKEAFSLNVRPSFHNFIQYLLDLDQEKRTSFNSHWRQMYKLCHPCHIQYDFVGHQETLQEDAEQILSTFKLDTDIRFPSANAEVTTRDFLKTWFSTVPLEDRRKLFKTYEKDFRLFGYSEPKELLDD